VLTEHAGGFTPEWIALFQTVTDEFVRALQSAHLLSHEPDRNRSTTSDPIDDKVMRKLEERREMLRDVYEVSQDAIFVVRGDRFLDCNHAAVELFLAEDKNTLLTKRLEELCPPRQANGEDSVPYIRESIERLLDRSTKGVPIEWTLRRLDGTPFPVEASITRSFMENQPVLHMLLRDIGERKRLQKLIHSVAEAIASDTGDALFQSVVEALATAMGAKHALIALHDVEEKGILRIRSLHTRTANPQQLPHLLQGEPWTSALRRESAFIRQSAFERYPHEPLFKLLGIESVAAIPLENHQGEILGLVAVLDTESRNDKETLHSLLRIFAFRIAAEIQRTRAENLLSKHAAEERALHELLDYSYQAESVDEFLSRMLRIVTDSEALPLQARGAALLSLSSSRPCDLRIAARLNHGDQTPEISHAIRLWCEKQLVQIRERADEENETALEIVAPPQALNGDETGLLVPLASDGTLRGALLLSTKPGNLHEVMRSNFLTRLATTVDMVVRRYEMEGEIYRTAHHDAVTQLPSRRGLLKVLRERLEQEHHGAVLLFDVGNFHAINESYGHEFGDRFIGLLSERLVKFATNEQLFLAHLGGDEFVIVHKSDAIDTPMLETAVDRLAHRLIELMESPVEFYEMSLHVTARVGVTLYPANGCSADEILKQTDTAARRAKHQGRRSVAFFSPQMADHAVGRINLESKLRTALHNQEFELRFQPKVAAKDSAVTGLEALLRWKHPQKGYVPPNVFMPLAEESGLISEIGAWVLTESCKIAQRLHNSNLKCGPMAVNVSATEFGRADFVRNVRAALATTGLNPEMLELEVTESVVMDDTDAIAQTLAELKQLGVKLSIDDFGTGYSSLSYLKRLPLDSLKIDKSFVDDLLHDSDSAAIAKTIISMGRSLYLDIVAEGVERQDQFDFLVSHGCEQLQGYLISMPLEEEELIVWLSNK